MQVLLLIAGIINNSEHDKNTSRSRHLLSDQPALDSSDLKALPYLRCFENAILQSDNKRSNIANNILTYVDTENQLLPWIARLYHIQNIWSWNTETLD
ncbi:hypothetical protein TNCV_3875971 [Trichonephila clavipes]|uniref:Uncharacterized protein n=1 Tax=Trichonephila clavipes TaxID=2585209 RepID=A0A8X6VRE8_TRICX|nr:hypothetical protein TNCV_3875971 [Trichonephila clavipes]